MENAFRILTRPCARLVMKDTTYERWKEVGTFGCRTDVDILHRNYATKEVKDEHQRRATTEYSLKSTNNWHGGENNSAGVPYAVYPYQKDNIGDHSSTLQPSKCQMQKVLPALRMYNDADAGMFGSYFKTQT